MDVLVAHPNPAVRDRLRGALGHADVAEVADADAALSVCDEARPPVVLAALELCDEDGGMLLQRIKRDPDLFRTSVVLVHHNGDADLLDGAEDLLAADAADVEVVARVRAAARTYALREQLLERERGLEELAYNDELTQLYNRRFLGGQLAALVRSATRHGRALSLVLVDIDRFKGVNDEYGHEKGDIVLARVAGRLSRVLRSEDFAGRWGGEEFLVVLPDIDEDGAQATAERLRMIVADRPVAGLGITVSCGCASWQPGESPDDLLRRADRALYAAKRAGRDTVQVAS